MLTGISGIKNYSNFNIYKELSKKLDKKTIIKATNDANAALLGELSSNYKDVNYAIQITIGTGIGGAIYNNGLISGNTGFGGEFGYIPVNLSKKQNLSENISSRVLVEKFKGKYANAKEIFKHEKESKIFKDWINGIAQFIISVQYMFDPELILLAGGVTKNSGFAKLVKDSINKIYKDFEYDLPVKIKISKLSNPGIVGAKNLIK